MKRLRPWLLRSIGLLLFAWLISTAEWARIGQLVFDINVSKLYWLPFISIFLIGLRTWRWNLLLGWRQLQLPAARAWSIYATGIFLGSFTPGRLGDLAKAAYLRQERGVSWEQATAPTLADRLFDVFFLLLLAGWALYHLDLWTVDLLHWAGAVGIGGLVFALFFRSGLLWRRLCRFLQHCRAGEFVAALRHELRALLRWAGWRALALTALAYGAYFAQTALLAEALGLALTLADVVAAITLIGLAAFLPISIAGLGTREGILALILVDKGVPHSLEAALMFSALFFFFCFVVPGTLGFVCWLKTPLSLDGIRERKIQGEHNG